MWSDERLDERFRAIDHRFDGVDRRLDDMRDEMRRGFADMRAEFAAMRAESAALRGELSGDISALRTALIQIGFGLVGVLIAALAAVAVAALS